MLEEKAEDLGRVLGQTDEYKALRRATEALREDQAVQKVLAEAERLAQEIERVAQQGTEPTKEQVEQAFETLKATPGIELNSWSTPSIFTAVTAVPRIDERRMRRSELPSVWP